MKPAFNVRQQSEIFIGPLADILSGVLPEGRVVVVSDSTIDRLYHSVLAQYDTVLIGLGESVKTMQTVEMIYRRFIELGVDRSTFVLAVGGGIVTDVAGTTRDRQYGKCSWNGREFSIVDTGGWVVKSDDIFEDAIRRQVIVATEEADVVLFVVDVSTGVTDWDEDVALILRRTKLPVILVANKVDNSSEYYQAADFYRLGLGDPQCVSAATGGGTGDLLDLLLEKMKTDEGDGVEEDIPRFAVVGRPNAGKSSIINAFIGEDRNIVTEIAGTTRDSIYTVSYTHLRAHET